MRSTRFSRGSHRIVFTLIMRITTNRESAEELTIDVFHDVWRGAARYDPEKGTVLAWIMNQARSRAVDRLRFESRKKRTHSDDVQSEADAAADPHDVLEFREQGEALRAALTALTPEERQAIETTFFAGLTQAEAATRLNEPLGTIKTRIRSGLISCAGPWLGEPGSPELQAYPRPRAPTIPGLGSTRRHLGPIQKLPFDVLGACTRTSTPNELELKPLSEGRGSLR